MVHVSSLVYCAASSTAFCIFEANAASCVDMYPLLHAQQCSNHEPSLDIKDGSNVWYMKVPSTALITKIDLNERMILNEMIG